ncbi:hypothetical protein L1987_23783 [Smallanthus sonchifolius]|uniref:Uncharacterized protein n=1 Tax=Smallanthus sonchifolius TaxID=185202 RepID=A0ACB9IIE7_9ASTR|nr:hypothetical protein L1987_23783 [Smallanthus sonchifolius]
MFHTSHAQNSPQDYLNAHNAARAQVGVGNMVWNPTLAAYAQNYANQRIGDCNLIHSGGPYGENLAKGSGQFTGTSAVNLWVNEKAFYDHRTNTCASGRVCGHYTQVVWRNSVQLGCARAQCANVYEKKSQERMKEIRNFTEKGKKEVEEYNVQRKGEGIFGLDLFLSGT